MLWNRNTRSAAATWVVALAVTLGALLTSVTSLSEPARAANTTAPAVVALTLINADTGQAIGPLAAGAVLDLAALPTRRLNVRAETNPAAVGSVRFAYDANPNFRTENAAPYTLAGDDPAGYFPWTPAVGAHTITAAAFAQGDATGTAGAPLSIGFTVVNNPAPAAPPAPTSTPVPPTPTPLPPTPTPVPPTPTPLPPTPTPTPTPAGPAVVALTLINADTGQAIGPLAGGAVLNLAALPSRRLNVRAETGPAPVGSVRFGLDATSNARTENSAPYTLAGDEPARYYSWTPSVGAHTLTATPYGGRDASGAAGAPLSVAFTVVDQAAASTAPKPAPTSTPVPPTPTPTPLPPTPTPTPTPAGPAVVALTLINADTGQAIGPLAGGAVLDLSALPTRRLSVRAETGPTAVGSVRFGLDANPNFRTENSAPYTLAGDFNNGKSYYPWTPTAGTHALMVTPYTKSGGTGTAGKALSVSFTVVERAAAPTPSPTPTPTPTPVSTTGLPAACKVPYTRLVNASTASQLATALKNAQPGDLIRLADGTYAGRFSAAASGTASKRITLCGSRKAVLDGGSTGAGNGFLVTGDYWTLAGFSVTRSLVGIVGVDMDHGIIRSVEVFNVGQAGIHLRIFSSDNVIELSYVHDTGKVNAAYGEGIYVGTASNQWCVRTNCRPDATDRTTIRGNTIGPNVTAQLIDLKEGTTGGVIADNILNGRGQTTAHYTDSWVIINGSGYEVRNNRGTGSVKHGFKVEDWERDGIGGNGNVFRGNTADVQNTGYGFFMGGGSRDNVVGCDNVVTNAGSGFASVKCT